MVDEGTILTNEFEFWNWSERFDHDVGNGSTGTLPVVFGDILGVGGNILEDIDQVLFDVAANSLGEVEWLLEDGSPCDDSIDIGFDGNAVIDIFWDFLKNATNGLDTSEDSSEVFLLEILEGDLYLTSNLLVVLQAYLDVLELVLVDELVREGGNEVNGIFLVNYRKNWLVWVEWIPSLERFSNNLHILNVEATIIDLGELVHDEFLVGWVFNHDEHGLVIELLWVEMLHFDFLKYCL